MDTAPQDHRKLYIIQRDSTFVVKNKEIQSGILSIKLKDRKLLVLTATSHVYKLDKSFEMPCSSTSKAKWEKVEALAGFKVNALCNSEDSFLTFIDNNGFVHRLAWGNLAIMKIPHVAMFTHGFVKMDSTKSTVVGQTNDF